MIAIGSAALLVGYLLVFAAVQGGRFTRNPLAGITEAGAGGSGSPAGGSSTVGGGPPIVVPGASRKCQLILDNYNQGSTRWDYANSRWIAQGCADLYGAMPNPPGTAHGTAGAIRNRPQQVT